MKTNMIIKISIYTTCICFAALCIFSFFFPEINILKSISTVAAVANALVIIYCKLAWKIQIKKIKFSSIPNLNGKWECIIKYNFDGKDREKISEVNIEQDLFGINVILITDEIKSNAITASIINEHGSKYLIYTYRTTPKQDVRDKNPIQYGTAKIDISDINNVYGEYWTTRKTQGMMYLKKKN